MTLKKSALFATASALLAAASIAQANEPGMPAPADAPAFEKLDKDTSGSITLEEAKGSWLSGAFAQVDINRDGYVTKSEYLQATG